MNTPVSFETAKLLKEKGFDIPVRTYRLEGKYSDFVYEGFEDNYWGDNKIVNWNKDVIGIKPFKGFVSAPTIAEVCMWLYEKHGIWIYVTIFETDTQYYCQSFIQRLNEEDYCVKTGKISHTPSAYNSPTEAYSAAIEFLLTKLI